MSKKQSIKDNVFTLLKDYPEARNSDKLLILKYWEVVDKIPMDSIDGFRKGYLLKSTNAESIRRARQLIQEDGQFLPTNDRVIARRRKKEVEMFDSVVNSREVVC